MQSKTNQKWQRRLRDTPVTSALERLVALAARLKRYNSENEARTINKLFSTDASKVCTMLRNGNQSVERPDPPQKETEIFWKKIWEKDASHNDKAKWIAELKADHQASVIQQQSVTISEEDLRLRADEELDRPRT